MPSRSLQCYGATGPSLDSWIIALPNNQVTRLQKNFAIQPPEQLSERTNELGHTECYFSVSKVSTSSNT